MRVLLLAAVLVAAVAAASMPLVDGEFVSLHVGVPGTQLWFWVRTDVAYVAVLPSAELRSFSRSWTDDDSEIVCAGRECARIRMAIDAIPPPPDPALRIPVPAQHYDGVLGLAPGSPVFTAWPYWRLGDRMLTLMATNEHIPHRVRRNAQEYPDGWVPVRVAGQPAWAQINLGTDYTAMPYEIAHTKHRWRLDVMDASGEKRVARVMVAPWFFVDSSADGSRMHAIRTAHALPNATPAVVAARSWAANTTVVLGRRLLQAGFTVQTDTLTGRVWLACDWQAAPHMRNIEFVLILLALIPLDILWVYTVYDSVDYVRRIDILTPPPPPAGNLRLRGASYDLPVPWGVVRPPDMPVQIMPTQSPVTALSYRHEGYAAAITLATQLAWTAVVLTILFGLGEHNYFWHETWGAYDAAAIYSTIGMSGAMAAALWLLPAYPVVMAGWGDSVVLMLLWLVAAGRPFVPANSLVMLLTSGAVAGSALKHALLMVSGRLWPIASYRRYGWLWLPVLCVVAAWSLWIFAFYTVRLITLSWRAETDGVYAVCSLALVLLVASVQLVMRRQHNMLIALRDASRTHIEQAMRASATALEKSRVAMWAPAKQ